jgi:gliding motility-associated-like protein/uncharacterized repeat protein (TIGR01451 family)
VDVQGGPIASLAPEEVDNTTFTATYVLTQEDIDAGKVLNIALARGEAPGGDPDDPNDDITDDSEDPTPVDEDEKDPDCPECTVTIIPQNPEMELLKDGVFNDENQDGFGNVGETITYTFTVTNTGNVTLSNITVEDDKVDVQGGPIANLAPEEVDNTTFTATYVLTQADIDAGKVLNIALARGEAPGRDPDDPNDDITDDSEDPTPVDEDEKDPDCQDCTVTIIPQNPGVKIEKSSDTSPIDKVGEVITYTLTVTNTGNVTLSNVLVSDPLTGFAHTINSLTPGLVVKLTTSYTVTQADIDAGSVSNLASANSTFNGKPVKSEDSKVVEAIQNASVALIKSADIASIQSVGELITYTLTVTNTGNVTLSNVLVSDPLTGFTHTINSLTPGQVVKLTTSYTVTQADIDAGSVTNLASANSTFNGKPVKSEDSKVVEAIQNASVALIKSADITSIQSVGEVITYTLTVTNTGNVTLTNVLVSDPLTGFAHTINSLTPGQVVKLTTTYAVSQADIDAGSVTNLASANSTFNGEPVKSEGSKVVEAIQNASVALIKSADIASIQSVGEVIAYTLTVTNTGNVTLTNVLVSDPLTGFEHTINSLTPGQVVKLTTTYAVSQADIDAGSVTNLASANSTFNGKPVKSEGSKVVEAIQNASVALIKSADITSIQSVGEVITYTLTVTNTGNVTLTNVLVSDPLTGFAHTINSLTPGQEVKLTTSYTVSQADIDAGSVLNQAIVKGLAPNNSIVGNEDEKRISSIYTPSIKIINQADKEVYSSVGEIIKYTYLVTNTGNVTLTNVVLVDPLTGVEILIGTLNPGESVTVYGIYSVTAIDMNKGTIDNTATVTGTAPNDSSVTDFEKEQVLKLVNIKAKDDNLGRHKSNHQGIIGNILTNDLLNGIAVNYSWIEYEILDFGGIKGLIFYPNGDFELIGGLNSPGTYILQYRICEKDNPSNCDLAYVTILLEEVIVDLSVEKSSFEAEIYEGDEFEYELRLSNLGGTLATNVMLIDDLPNGVTFLKSNVISVSSSLIQVETPLVTGNRLTWKIPFFPADGMVVIRIRVQAGDAGTITNIVSVSAQEEDINKLNNQDDDVNQVLPFRIPNVITPNQDGNNDTFEVKGLNKFVSNEIVIINRYGDHVFERKDYQNDWNAPGQVSGTYFYILTTVDNAGKYHTYKGWIQVIKN